MVSRRIREGNWSCTLLQGKPNCLYFQHGSFSVYLSIYGNLCDRRNFLADTLVPTETDYRMTSHAAGWYYLPFREPPETSDWWATDNPHRREKIEGLPLDTTLDIVKQPDGIDLHLTANTNLILIDILIRKWYNRIEVIRDGADHHYTRRIRGSQGSCEGE